MSRVFLVSLTTEYSVLPLQKLQPEGRRDIFTAETQEVGVRSYLVMMARWGGAMQAPMKRTTFSCLVCL